jgi:integrase
LIHRKVEGVQRTLGHASAAMTLDVYSGLFYDDLDGVADRRDTVATKAAADYLRTNRTVTPVRGRAAGL